MQRVQEEVQHALSSILLFEVDEPLFEKLTVTRVLVTKDLSMARVYYDTRGTMEERGEIQKALERLRFTVRRVLATKISIKKLPDLEFFYDETGEEISKVEALLAAIGSEKTDKKA